TLQLKNVRLSTLLDVMLEDLGLVYTEKDDLVVITTPDDAQATMEVRVYDCRDLLTMPTVSLPRPGMMPGVSGFPEGYGVPGDGSRPRFQGGEPGAGAPGYPARPRGFAPGGTTLPGPRSGNRLPGEATSGAPPGGEGGFAPESVGPPASAPAAPRRPRNDILPQAAGLRGVGGHSSHVQ